MLKAILLVLVAIVAVLLIVIAMQPSEYQVQRTALISAPPEIVFEQVNDLHKFQAWSPWARMDPDSKVAFSGAPSGAGASFTWSGSKTGEGSMTITGSRSGQSVTANLDFIKPFESSSVVEFDFEPKGEQTEVTWKMTGENTFATKAFQLFVNMDKLVGGDFEKGLAQLNAIVAPMAAHQHLQATN
jgi:polyketide cyclase/dehydrase/lipid transport protein